MKFVAASVTSDDRSRNPSLLRPRSANRSVGSLILLVIFRLSAYGFLVCQGDQAIGVEVIGLIEIPGAVRHKQNSLDGIKTTQTLVSLNSGTRLYCPIVLALNLLLTNCSSSMSTKFGKSFGVMRKYWPA